MNISSVISNTINTQRPLQPPKPAMPEPKVLEVDPEKAAKEARAKAFYTREKEPWKGKFYIYGDDFVKSELRPMDKNEYLSSMKMLSRMELVQIQCRYDSFRKELADLRPDLAAKNFSYTLGDDAQIKVIVPENKLTDEEMEWLTKAFNDVPQLKEHVQAHAKIMMALVDHDTEKFGGKYILNLMNFQDVIDYGKVVSIRKNDLDEEWIRQIHQNAEKRETSLLDIIA